MRTATLSLLVTLALAACRGQIDQKPAATVNNTDAVAKAEQEAPAEPEPGMGLDRAASRIGFVGAKVTGEAEGQFEDIDGKAVLEGDAVRSITLTVQTGSVSVDPPRLQEHLMSEDFFDAQKHPVATFRSSSITPQPAGENTHVIEGTLDLHGVTQTIAFPARIMLEAGRASGKAEFTIDRKAFGIVYAGAPDDLIRDEVLLKIDLTFTDA